MTVKEFWHLKYGTVVSDETVIPSCCGNSVWGWRGKVVKREIIDECAGFIITKSKSYDIKTGRKLLEITFDCGNGEYRYCNTSQDLSNLKIVTE